MKKRGWDAFGYDEDFYREPTPEEIMDISLEYCRNLMQNMGYTKENVLERLFVITDDVREHLEENL